MNEHDVWSYLHSLLPHMSHDQPLSRLAGGEALPHLNCLLALLAQRWVHELQVPLNWGRLQVFEYVLYKRAELRPRLSGLVHQDRDQRDHGFGDLRLLHDGLRLGGDGLGADLAEDGGHRSEGSELLRRGSVLCCKAPTNTNDGLCGVTIFDSRTRT